MNAPAPLMAPEKLAVLEFPAMSVPLPRVTLPAPASEPMVSLKLFRLKTAPLLTTSGEVLAIRSSQRGAVLNVQDARADGGDAGVSIRSA